MAHPGLSGIGPAIPNQRTQTGMDLERVFRQQIVRVHWFSPIAELTLFELIFRSGID